MKERLANLLKSACIVAVFLLFLPSLAYSSGGVRTYGTLWFAGSFLGPLSKNHPKIKYYLESQLRLIHNTYAFSEAYLYAGLAYQLTDDLVPAMGVARSVSENLQGQMLHEDRFWQMLLWDMIKNNHLVLSNRSRLEQRKDTVKSQIAWRLRERFQLRVPLKFWGKHSVDLWDEMFFNFNHPAWLGNKKVFAENRAFIGIGTPISNNTVADVGYLNQYQFTTPNTMTNGLYLSVTYRA